MSRKNAPRNLRIWKVNQTAKKFAAIFFGYIILSIIVLSTGCAEQSQAVNLLKNGGFESADDGQPAYWYRDMWVTDYGASYLEIVRDEQSGSSVARIENVSSNDARFTQTVSVEPNQWYKLSGLIRAEGCDTEGTGANLSVLGSYSVVPSLYDTAGAWEEWTIYFKTYAGQRSANIAARLGGYSNETTGVAWFDDLSLEQADAPLPGELAVELSAPSSPAQNSGAPTNGSLLWLIIPLFAAVVFIVMKARPRGGSLAALMIILGAAAVLRIAVAYFVAGYGVDIGCFHAWALRIAQVGPADFYQGDYFCDYPPGYMYFLWPIGWLIRAVGVSAETSEMELLVKLPPIIFDLAAIAALWHIGNNKNDNRVGFALAALYAFSPAIVATGAAWGQIDCLLALGLALTVWRASKSDMRAAIPIYMLTVLIKPQALMLGPLGLLAVILHLRELKWDAGAIRRALLGAGIGLAACFLLILPFTIRSGWAWLPGKYLGTMASYDYATINAVNLYYLMGGNWVASGAAAIGSISYASIAIILMALTLAATFALYIKSRSLNSLFLAAGLTFLGFFLFGYRMHERYLLPAIVFFLAAYSAKRDGRLLWLSIGLSVTMFFNVWLVLRNEHLMYGALHAIGCVLSAINLLLGALAFWTGWEICVVGRTREWGFASTEDANNYYIDSSNAERSAVSAGISERILGKSDARLNFRPLDWALMLALTGVYAVVAFTGLGSHIAPQTWWRSSGTSESVLFDLGETKSFQILYYNGISSSDIKITASEDGETWTTPMPASVESECFRWKYVVYSTQSADGAVSYNDDIPQLFTARYVRIIPDAPGVMLFEVALRDLDGNILSVNEVIDENPREVGANDVTKLIDEPNTVPDQPGYMNGTYFDEIYHARTGYEYLHKMSVLEWSHPPLGKVFIMLSISLMGMTPFAWRFPGTLAGVLMIPAMYFLGKQLFKKTRWALLAAFLLAADCMHLAQTRIATIDSYPVLFIMLMYACMYRYWKMSFFRDGLGRTLVPLALSGLFMAGAIASKWIGIYAAAGLAVVLFWSFGMRLREYIYGISAGAEESQAVAAYPRRMIITILWCVLWFIIVPAAVYLLSYIPELTATGPYTIKRVIDLQASMYNYHSHLVDTHPFKSKWWEWPLILKPMWYYQGHYEPDGMVSTILAFGNPAVWWTGFIALIAVIIRWFKGHVSRGIRLDRADGDSTPGLLLVGFLAQFMPWVLVPRSTFIYHYFASTPFVMLCIVWGFVRMYERASAVDRALRTPRRKKLVSLAAAALAAAAALLFVGFYPFATGALMPRAWAQAMNWFSGLYLPGWAYAGWMWF
ncbi:MAG: glycosyltransferase family 39 protein [Oscillospiraceae bacterium]|jgi:Gpi18-like mannosyltransferase/4-amino-4-deoxy-L-arabinose transferase-like glycosyltransferase|nr:glycosyltransferase family 39 protein [Oscillospiraceae bacterium]